MGYNFTITSITSFKTLVNKALSLNIYIFILIIVLLKFTFDKKYTVITLIFTERPSLDWQATGCRVRNRSSVALGVVIYYTYLSTIVCTPLDVGTEVLEFGNCSAYCFV